jgi:hypothetical protein
MVWPTSIHATTARLYNFSITHFIADLASREFHQQTDRSDSSQGANKVSAPIALSDLPPISPRSDADRILCAETVDSYAATISRN